MFEILILLLAVPIGFLIAWLARDELIVGKIYFKILMIVSILGIIFSVIYGENTEGWSFGFILIISYVSFLKSKDKKWTKKRV